MRRKRARAKQWTVVQLLDLGKYLVERVERWPGWGRLFLKRKRSAYPCSGCGQIYMWYQSRRWRRLRDLV